MAVTWEHLRGRPALLLGSHLLLHREVTGTLGPDTGSQRAQDQTAIRDLIIRPVSDNKIKLSESQVSALTGLLIHAGGEDWSAGTCAIGPQVPLGSQVQSGPVP